MTETFLTFMFLVILLFIVAFGLFYFRNKSLYASILDGKKISLFVLKDGTGPEFGRMEWTDGEEITVFRRSVLFGERHVLRIMSHTNEGSRSIAEVAGGLPLIQRGRFTYFGVFPASAFRISRRKVMVAGSIPKVQKLEQDSENRHLYKADTSRFGYMYAISSGRSRTAGDDGLQFKPLFSTLVLRLHSPADNYLKNKLVCLSVSSAQEGAFLSGSFEALLDSKTRSFSLESSADISGGANTITVYFGHGIQLGKTSEEDTVLHLLATPMDHTMMTLSLRFDNGVVRSVNLTRDDAWITAKACSRTVFSNIAIPGIMKEKYADEICSEHTDRGQASNISTHTTTVE